MNKLLSHNYTAKFKVKGMGEVELDISKEDYDKLSAYCKAKLPEKNWKCK